MASLSRTLQTVALLCLLSGLGVSDTQVQQGDCILVVEDEVKVDVDVVHNGHTYQDVEVVISDTYRGYKCKQGSSSTCDSTHIKAQSFHVTPSQDTLNEAKTYAVCKPQNVVEVTETATVTVGGSQVDVTLEWSNITSCTCHRFAAGS